GCGPRAGERSGIGHQGRGRPREDTHRLRTGRGWSAHCWHRPRENAALQLEPKVIWAFRAGGLLLVIAVLVTAVIAVAAGGEPPTPVTGATIGIHFSKFKAGDLTVPAGEPVTFVIANEDP